MIRFIAAVDAKLGIADGNGIPWQGQIPSDVAYFRSKTLGGIVMMGAGWYKEQLRPLADRRNLVATSAPGKLRPGFEKIMDAREYLKHVNEDVWVGGGAGLFAATIDLADELYLTRLSGNFHCTKFFPAFKQDFERIDTSEPITENGITFHYEVWYRLHKQG